MDRFEEERVEAIEALITERKNKWDSLIEKGKNIGFEIEKRRVEILLCDSYEKKHTTDYDVMKREIKKLEQEYEEHCRKYDDIRKELNAEINYLEDLRNKKN